MEAMVYVLTALITLAAIGALTFLFLHREIRRDTGSRKRPRSHHDTALGKEQGFTDTTRGFWVEEGGTDSATSSND